MDIRAIPFLLGLRLFLAGFSKISQNAAMLRYSASQRSIDCLYQTGCRSPGDQIQVQGGILHINSVPVERTYLGQATATDGYSMMNFKVYEETLPNGSRHLIQERSDNDSYDNTAVYKVPEGHYFMMGDNRDNSRDSRTTSVGIVPAENMVGRADRLFFSHNGNARIWEIWKWPFAIRYGRIGDGII